MPLSPQRPTLEQMIALTEQLTERLSKDAAAFEARRPQEVTARMAETLRLANTYRLESARLRGSPDILRSASQEVRGRLIKASEGFDQALRRHGRSLYALKTVTEGVVKSIAEEVIRMRGVGAGYGASARQNAPNPTAITLNRRA